MSQPDSHEILTMRAMAWERAKGELHAYLHTYWPRFGRDAQRLDNGFDEADRRIREFIQEFEDNCR